MRPVREAILDAVALVLQGLAGVTVEVMPPGDPQALPALQLGDLGQRVLAREADRIRFEQQIEIAGYVRATATVEARAALGALYRDALGALFANEQLGGLAELMTEGDMTVEVAELADERTLAFGLTLGVQHTAKTTDRTQI